jgi:cellulose synthase/poly-beta-1,6-N-acetylglucosamine synthase-like glycosyltransferase
MLRFSIVVPAYNEEKNIGKCLDSLANLDFDKDKYEIIVVNNNSTDKTKEIAESFSGIKVIDETNQGIVYALIKGCQESQGEIIAFTDADSMVPKDWLKKISKAYENERVICVGGRAKFRPLFFTVLIAELFSLIFSYFTKISYCFNLSVRKKTYQEFGGFNPGINFQSDVYLVLKAKKYGKAVFLANNPVISSSRHFRGFRGLVYMLKGLVNFPFIVFRNKSFFYHTGNVRD